MNMARFVILRHEMPNGSERVSHWDWMFEMGEVLRTWATDALPSGDRLTVPQRIPATPLADHRPIYLDYTGPISGERGRVTSWDAGNYVLEEATSQVFAVQIAGRRLHGSVRFIEDRHADQRVTLEFIACPAS